MFVLQPVSYHVRYQSIYMCGVSPIIDHSNDLLHSNTNYEFAIAENIIHYNDSEQRCCLFSNARSVVGACPAVSPVQRNAGGMLCVASIPFHNDCVIVNNIFNFRTVYERCS